MMWHDPGFNNKKVNIGLVEVTISTIKSHGYMQHKSRLTLVAINLSHIHVYGLKRTFIGRWNCIKD